MDKYDGYKNLLKAPLRRQCTGGASTAEPFCEISIKRGDSLD